LLAQGTIPPLILLEDAEDLCYFLQFTKRTVRASWWAEEAVAAAATEQIEGLF
jgi:hypothetical protein